MANHATKKKSTAVYVILTIIVIAILGVALYFILNQDTNSTSGGIFGKNIKNETITAENYEEMMDRISQEFDENDEDIYYLSYSMMYYMMRDGMSSALSGNEDESAMYSNIYGKTIQQLIDEGKQLMEENDITLEQYKENLKNTNSIFE